MIKPETINGKRVYPRDGQRYDSVTTIIGEVLRSRWLEKWRGDVGNRIADKKRDAGAKRGTSVHQACVLVGTDTPEIPLPLPDEQELQVEAFNRWYDLCVEETLDTETTIFNVKYGYAGTYDKRVIIKGDKLPTIIDIKSGVVDAARCKLQLSAYRGGDGVVSHRRIIVDLKNIKSDGLPTIHEYLDHASDFNAFLSIVGVYRWLINQ